MSFFLDTTYWRLGRFGVAGLLLLALPPLQYCWCYCFCCRCCCSNYYGCCCSCCCSGCCRCCCRWCRSRCCRCSCRWSWCVAAAASFVIAAAVVSAAAVGIAVAIAAARCCCCCYSGCCRCCCCFYCWSGYCCCWCSWRCSCYYRRCWCNLLLLLLFLLLLMLQYFYSVYCYYYPVINADNWTSRILLPLGRHIYRPSSYVMMTAWPCLTLRDMHIGAEMHLHMNRVEGIVFTHHTVNLVNLSSNIWYKNSVTWLCYLALCQTSKANQPSVLIWKHVLMFYLLSLYLHMY